MFGGASQDLGKRNKWTLFTSSLSFALLVVAVILGDSRPAYTLPLPRVQAIPAFARKYGLPCSACHEAWPKLNNFGQTFKDNGYQLGNDRDAPIWQQPTYWPIALRMTPHWHRENTDHVPVDDPATESTIIQGVTTHGFDLSGMDMLTAGTLAKNISFLLVPSADNTGAFHFESANVRFSNLLNTSWLNVKVGKFELDNMVSEKRIMTLSANGGLFQLYHFLPQGDTTPTGFGLGDNQLGVEVSGHSRNDYTRYSVAVLSGSDGTENLPYGRGYDTYLTFSQAFDAGSLGLQRVGVYSYIGQAPTIFPTSGGAPIAGAGVGNEMFYRTGFFGLWYIKKLDFTTFFMHGSESAYLGTGTPADQTLPVGAKNPSWNGGWIETHYTLNPQFILIQRYELIRMSQQALPGTAGNLGDIDSLTFGYRYYPFMTSRAGFAFHNEYARVRQRGTGPLPGQDLTTNSLFLGFDFVF
ncbi:MAG: hypothetical protein LAN61_05220 [Acidobacteriia bacterium]|nr:hypothetical protein [Terriglobia bacterium]